MMMMARSSDLADHLLNLRVGAHVDGGRALVHDQDLRVTQHRAAEAKQLALPDRQAVAPVADLPRARPAQAQ